MDNFSRSNWVHASLEFSGLPLLIGLDGTPAAGAELIGDVDIDAAGRVMHIRLASAIPGERDIDIERTHDLWPTLERSIRLGMRHEIEAATADPDETYDSFVREHALRACDVL